ncbi:MAG: Oligopeptide transport system permease protein OppB [Verrucomicrobiota bacterium]|jgi:oligopeptide transport system permease protein
MKALLVRVALIPLMVWVVATLSFFLLRAVPGGPFDRERAAASREVEAALKARYHWDEPIWRQYLRYLGNLLQGDLGPSLKYRNHSVNDLLRQTVPVSLSLGAMAFGVALGLGIPLGTLAALGRHRWADQAAGLLTLVGVCVPVFVLGPFLILVLGLWLGWLPVALWGSGKNAVLPTLTLGLYFAARISRWMREGMQEVLKSPHVQAARAKGLGETRVILRHAVPVALLPVISYTGPMLADLLTGSFVVENVFQIPGTGAFFINSFFSRDYTMMMGMVLFYSLLLQVLNLLSDLLLRWVDPRVRA